VAACGVRHNARACRVRLGQVGCPLQVVAEQGLDDLQLAAEMMNSDDCLMPTALSISLVELPK
jgi:hypothetical protein